MDVAGLPIMVFDEHSLTPSLGYVFDRRWLDPFESIVSILWKLARMNRLPGQLIVMQVAKSCVDPYEGVDACATQVDIRHLHRTLGLSQRQIRESMSHPKVLDAEAPLFRYCRKCLNRGYHSVLHQSSCARYCPIHGTSLEVRCRTCDATAPYRLHVRLLDAPYRCGNCGHLYGTTPPPSLPYKRPLGKKARIAVTRMYFGQYGHF